MCKIIFMKNMQLYAPRGSRGQRSCHRIVKLLKESSFTGDKRRKAAEKGIEIGAPTT